MNERTIEIFTNSPENVINERSQTLQNTQPTAKSIPPPPKKCVLVSDVKYRDCTENFCKIYLRFICFLEKKSGNTGENPITQRAIDIIYTYEVFLL